MAKVNKKQYGPSSAFITSSISTLTGSIQSKFDKKTWASKHAPRPQSPPLQFLFNNRQSLESTVSSGEAFSDILDISIEVNTDVNAYDEDNESVHISVAKSLTALSFMHT
jgi:hypothetical protein